MAYKNRILPSSGVLGGMKGVMPNAQSIPNGAWTTITALVNWVDIVPGTVSRPGGHVMRVNSAGWWMIGAAIGFSGGTSSTRAMLVQTWTGTDPGPTGGTHIISQQYTNVGASSYAMSGSTVVYLAANTNVRLCAYQNSGSALSTSTSFPTELWLTRIL